MKRLISKTGNVCLNPHRRALFKSLVYAIIHQQLSGNVANTIFLRFKLLFGSTKFPSYSSVLDASTGRLLSAGLSRQKTVYILELAKRAEARLLPSLKECEEMTDEEIMTNLTNIKGIGRWTVEMFLIFNLGRQDVLPTCDLGIQKGFKIAYKKRNLPDVSKLLKYGERWRPYRTVASLYLWKAAGFLKEGDLW